MFEVVMTKVFALEKDGGNPCPVVLNADELSSADMQSMTKKFGYESAFVLKADLTGCDVRFRYFVPLHEMEMCIHATIGSITVLVDRGIITVSPVRIQTALGAITAEWERNDSGILVSVNQFLPKKKEKNPTKEEVCRALCITDGDILPLPIRSVATSRYKLIVPLKDKDVVNRLKPDFEYLWELCDKYETTGFYPFAVENVDGKEIYHARQFPKRAGYQEDPATGVAASALGAYLTEVFPAKVVDGWNEFLIVQGVAMGKASCIRSGTLVENSIITATKITGQAELVY